MKKQLMMLSILILPVCSHAVTESGTVTITGKVVQASCTVDSIGDNGTVDLGTFLDNDFTGFDSKGKPVTTYKEFTLKLKDCGENNKGVTITTQGQPYVTGSFVFKNTSLESAQSSVGVDIYAVKTTEPEDIQMDPENTQQVERALSGTNPEIAFKAALVNPTSNRPTSGSVSTVVTFNLNYK